MKKTMALFLTLATLSLPAVHADTLIGPEYPPLYGVTFTTHGSTNGGAGRPDGMTWRFTNTVLSAYTPVFWGVTNNGVKLSFLSDLYTSAETMSFNNSLSDLPNGRVVWTGQTSLPNDARTVHTRCTMIITNDAGTSLALENAVGLSLPTAVGGVLRVTSPSLLWYANFKFSAAFDSSGTFQPALDFFEANKSIEAIAYSSFGAGFYHQRTVPTITPIADIVVPLNTSTNIPFTINDIETPATSLTLTADSSNTALVPLTNIVFGGSGSNRTVTITPATNQYGQSFITIHVSDGLDTNSILWRFSVNHPPELNANTLLTVTQGNNAVITSALLRASDDLSSPSNIVFTVGRPGSGNAAPRNGVLLLNGSSLADGQTFTQQNINDGLLSYRPNTNGCQTNDDWGFFIKDGHGGITPNPTGPFTSYKFSIRITFLDRPPIATDRLFVGPLGAVYHGLLRATNPDCLSQSFTYRIVTNGIVGTMTLTNVHTGGFLYVAHPGQSGVDKIYFQVSDGTQEAITNGVFTFNIANRPPVANSNSFSLAENTVKTGLLSAIDPDTPPQPLTFTIVSNATKGTVVITNAITGGFVFTPHPGRFGFDSFTFKVSDGSLTSAPVVARIQILHTLAPGDLVVTDSSSNRLVAVIDPRTGDTQPLSSGGKLTEGMFGLTVEASGTILVADNTSGLIRINPTNGIQTTVVSNSVFQMPINVKTENNGNILVSDIANGLLRFNITGTLLTNFPAGNAPNPAGLYIAENGAIFVTDPEAFMTENPADNKIVRIDPLTLVQTIVSSGGSLVVPIGIALENSGNLLVADGGSMAEQSDKILRIDPINGAQTVLSSGNLLSFPTGLVINQAGDIFTPNANGTVVKIDPVTGAQSLIHPLGIFKQLTGIALVPGSLPKPILYAPTFITNGISITFSGVPGRTYQVQRTLTLSSPSWQLVTSMQAPIDGLMRCEDLIPVGFSAFYRAIMQ